MTLRWLEQKYLGPVQVPPLPAMTVIQSRDTGEWFGLTHAGEPGALQAILTTAIPSGMPTIRYPVPEGPIIGNGRVRLYAKGTCIYAELVEEGGPDIRTASVYTRKGGDPRTLSITAPRDWQPGDPLILTEYAL